MPTERRIERMRTVLKNRQRDLAVVCENIHDPHNVSAILRSCDAVGVSDVHLLYSRESFPELGKKSSASAKKWVELHRHREDIHLKSLLKSQGKKIYATRLSPAGKSIYQVDWQEPAAIILGNEHRGVSEEAASIADETIFIPMFGMVESLNVSVAAAVILYEICRQRIAGSRYPFLQEEDAWFLNHSEEWIKRG